MHGPDLLPFLPPLLVAQLLVIWVAWAAVGARARRAGVDPASFQFLTAVGWGVGFVVMPVAAAAFIDRLDPGARLSDRTAVLLTLAACLAGGIVGAAVGYVLLRMRTVRHPDYEEDGGRPPSQVAHVRQARDGDDVLPE
jgi:hypothetical protein